jgi:hypothetical protein
MITKVKNTDTAKITKIPTRSHLLLFRFFMLLLPLAGKGHETKTLGF